MSKTIALVNNDCVACGVCAKSCPREAVLVWKGVRAVVNPGLCIGCGRCAAQCPASMIELVSRED